MLSPPHSPTSNAPPPPYEPSQGDFLTALPTPPSSPIASPIQSHTNNVLLPLTIPTKKYPLSSGFPYHSSIFDLGISPATWTLFSNDIVQATKLSLTQQSLAWTSGLSIGLVSVAAVPPFGAAAGVFAGKAVYDKTVLHNVKQGLDSGKLGEVLRRWNEGPWSGQGVTAKLVVKPNKQPASNKKQHQREKGVGRFELVLESCASIIPTTQSMENLHVVEIEDTRNLAELQNSQPPARYELPLPTPNFADEKAIAAETSRLSWTSAHPSELEAEPTPIFRLITHDLSLHTTNPQKDPMSGISLCEGDEVAQEWEISPLSQYAGERSYDAFETAMTPAPLFSR